VEGIADATAFAEAVIGAAHAYELPCCSTPSYDDAAAQKRILCESAKCEGDRCLNCNTVCECCVDVCPNRANVIIELPDGRHQIVHVDRMCNECGNCAVFCPYSSAPYKEKLTLFQDRENFDASPENNGFMPLGGRKILIRLDGKTMEYDLSTDKGLPNDIEMLIVTIYLKYGYLMA